MRSTFGKNIRVSIWGGSHEPAIGVDIEGLPIGTVIDMNELCRFMQRRAPGNSPFATKRKEPDIPVPVSGLTPAGKGDMLSAADVLKSGQIASAATGTPDAAPEVSGAANAVTQDAMPVSAESDIMIVTGDKVSLEIRNTDTRSGDYKSLRSVPRPGHADYTARMRYGDGLNMAGGGPFSARMTAPLCIAGGIALQILRRHNIEIGAHIYSVGDIKDKPFDPVNIVDNFGLITNLRKPSMIKTPGSIQTDDSVAKLNSVNIKSQPASLQADAPTISDPASVKVAAEITDKTIIKLFNRLKTMDFPVLDEAAGESMKALILNARDNLDSVGGIVESCITGLPAGIGGAMYDGLESSLAPILFGIPAVKGVEFGAGFEAAEMKGSENNDPFYYDGEAVRTRTNNHGGILGGITTGMPLITRIAFKPTPSISREQDSVNLDTKENTKLVIKGRHDPCVVVRAVPIVEAALAVGILDQLLAEEPDIILHKLNISN